MTMFPIENEIARLGLQDYVDQALVPTQKVVQIRKGKKKLLTGIINIPNLIILLLIIALLLSDSCSTPTIVNDSREEGR